MPQNISRLGTWVIESGDGAEKMLLLAICTLSLATAVATQPTPASYREQRILSAMSSGEAITLRLRGGGGTVSSTVLDRKQRILRAVSSGQAVTEDALFAIEAAATMTDRPPPTTWDDPRHSSTSSGASPALVRHAASGFSFAAAAVAASAVASGSGGRPTRMCHRKRRMLRAMGTGHSVTHAVERGYVSSC